MALTETEKEKKVGQLKLQFNGVLEPFNIHGLGIYLPEVKEHLAEL